MTNGNCTLGEAISAANTDTAVDACAAGNGRDIIQLPAGTYTLDNAYVTLDDGGPNGLPPVATRIVIWSPGATITRSAAADTPEFRLFLVQDTGQLDLYNLTLSNGRLNFQATAPNGDEIDRGGAILNDGTLNSVRLRVHR